MMTIYPVGRHRREVAISAGVERVRRARLSLDIIDRAGGPPLPMLKPGEHLLPAPPRFAPPTIEVQG